MTGNEPTTAAPASISPSEVGTTIYVDPRLLRPFHRNPRRGDAGVIMASLIVNGQYKPVVVNLGSKTGRPAEVLAGSHTLKAFLTLAEQDPLDSRWYTIAAHVLDVDDDMANRIVLVDNRAFDLGLGADAAAVLDLVEAIGSAVGTGYTEAELDRLEAALGANKSAGPDAEPSEAENSPDAPTGPDPEFAPPSSLMPPSPGTPVNSHTIVFDSDPQLQVWFEFVAWLENVYSDPNLTPVQRLSAFLAEMPPERRI
jgi:hypothetical protein